MIVLSFSPTFPPTASPAYEESEGGEESVYDDRMHLEQSMTCRATRGHVRRASDSFCTLTHSCQAAAAALRLASFVSSFVASFVALFAVLAVVLH